MDEQAEHNISYFRNLWQTSMTDLQSQCDAWEMICKKDPVPDEVHGDIRTNIGLAKLLMNQKLKQFKGLINDSEFNTGEKEITCLDLQGFWDMVFNEVSKILQCFDRLEKCRNNAWKFDDVNPEKRPKKKVKKEITALKEKDDASKSHALAAKQRLAEAKKKMLALHNQQKQQHFVEIAELNNKGFNHAEIVNSSSNGNSSDTVKISIMAESGKSVKNLKQGFLVNGKQTSFTKTSDQVESIVFNKELKHKANYQKGLTPSVQNKENFVPDDDVSNVKYNSKTQTKSRERNEVPSSTKRGKQRDYGKLQCVTRSAKKALLSQQNMLQKS